MSGGRERTRVRVSYVPRKKVIDVVIDKQI